MNADLQDKCVNCKTCGKTLWKGNASGYCRKHISPERRAKMVAGINRKIQEDPIYLEKLKAQARKNAAMPGHIEKMAEAGKRAETWRIALAATTPESYKRAGRSLSERLMAWCPRELRDQYRHLNQSKKIKAAEARQMILDQHEKDMAEFRRKLSA